jgi:mycofactocin glycosyltransferase
MSDESLRYGEDVDLVWRLHDAGWSVRYEPAAVVTHAEPGRWQQLTRRRFAYGSAAGPLARRHPERLAPVRLHPRPVAVLALASARRPWKAAGAMTVHIALTARSLRTVDVPVDVAAMLALRGVVDTTRAVGRAATILAPGLLMAGLCRRLTRPAALGLLLVEPLLSWAQVRPELDPLRWTALAIADDVAYGAGVGRRGPKQDATAVAA